MPSRRKDPKAPRPAHYRDAKVASDREKIRHLILDGYNCIHAHPELKKIMVERGSDAARDALGKAVSLLHDYEGWMLTIVFDGHGNSITLERPLKKVNTLSYLYSPTGITADEVIEGLVIKCGGRDDVVVASADGAIRLTIQINGARWLPPEELWRWVREAQDSLGRALKTNSLKEGRL